MPNNNQNSNQAWIIAIVVALIGAIATIVAAWFSRPPHEPVVVNPPTPPSPTPPQPSPPPLSSKAGFYEGTAINKTSQLRGKITLDVRIDNLSPHQITAKLSASEGLQGEADLKGTINDDARGNLSGEILLFDPTSNTSTSSPIEIDFKFVEQNQMQGKYRIDAQPGSAFGTQYGEFEVRKVNTN